MQLCLNALIVLKSCVFDAAPTSFSFYPVRVSSLACMIAYRRTHGHMIYIDPAAPQWALTLCAS